MAGIYLMVIAGFSGDLRARGQQIAHRRLTDYLCIANAGRARNAPVPKLKASDAIGNGTKSYDSLHFDGVCMMTVAYAATARHLNIESGRGDVR